MHNQADLLERNAQVQINEIDILECIGIECVAFSRGVEVRQAMAFLSNIRNIINLDGYLATVLLDADGDLNDTTWAETVAGQWVLELMSPVIIEPSRLRSPCSPVRRTLFSSLLGASGDLCC